MNRVKYTTSTTGTGSLTISVAPGFQDLPDSINTFQDSTGMMYTLLDVNGTAWEVGYGTLSGSTFSRDAIFESTNSDTAINLSAGTHTLLVNRSFYEGHVITQGYISGGAGYETVPASSTKGSYHVITFAATMGHDITSQPVDGLSYVPGKTGGTVADIVAVPESEIPYCRGFRLTLKAKCEDVHSGEFFGCGIDVDGFGRTIVADIAPQNDMISDGTVVTCTSPIFRNLSPFGGSNYGYIPYGGIRYLLYNTYSSSSITVYPSLFIEWFL